ncbi:sensor histidine kinase [Spirochaeta isovalerica]|uniref:histidine kinase n=1 Tax=Spirochaeta isovalerica TaxID=150 RepID=A0A841R983_9SPIO|nr:two-component regulator propeller domain-containing protein [Spirochaeta isovalerica]MBB6480465.1 PAS domain S-box-containing protein [Spirochaeta isovalerica]
MRNLICLIFPLVFLTLPLLADGSEKSYFFDTISREDGLSNSSVSSIQQDSKGFLWFGTQSGLLRYDGYIFEKWSHNAFDTNTLPHELVQTLFIDEQDIIWVGTYNGLSRFSPLEGTFTNYSYETESDSSISNSIVTAIAKDSRGRIWAATLDGLNRLDGDSGGFTKYFHDEKDPSSLADNVVRSLLTDSAGRLWVGTLGGMDLYDEESDSFIHYNIFPSSYVMKIMELDSDTLLVGTWDGGLSEFSISRKSISHKSFANNSVYSIETDSSGNIWVGTWGGGLFIYNRKDDSVVRLQSGPGDLSLKSDTIYSLFRDGSGDMWVGTNGGGVSVLNPGKQDYNFLSADSPAPPVIDQGKVNALLEDREGYFWISIYNKGINRVNPHNGEIIRFSREADNENRRLENNIVADILEDRDGNIWIATNEGLNMWNPLNDEMHRISLKALTGYSRNDYYIFTGIYQDSEGIFWAGTHNSGLIRYDSAKNSSQLYSMDPENESSISDNLIYDILERKNGQLWIATNKGLNLLDRKTGLFTRFLLDRSNRTGINSNNVRQLLESRNGELWIGTGGGGINRYNDEDGTFTHITNNEGLSDNFIMSLVEGDGGKLWIGTKYGLSIYDRESGKIDIIDSNNGLKSPEITSGALKGSDGQLYFGAADRVYRFHSSLADRNSIISRIHVTSMEIGGEKYDDFLSYRPSGNIKLGYSDSRYISFDFVALNYLESREISYTYKLEGFDREWRTPSTRRYAIYTNIPPGSYIFKIKASLDQRDWKEMEVPLNFTITPPLWRQWWAYLIYALVFTAILYLMISLRINRIRREQLLELQRTETYLSEILNSMPSLFMAIDDNRIITQWNKETEKHYGIGPETALGKDILSITDDIPLSAEEIELCMNKGEIISKSRRIEGADQQIRCESITIYPIISHGIRSAVIRIDDVTKEVQLEEALVQNEKLLSIGGLAAGMAHEINNPLAGMIQNVSVLQNRLLKSEGKRINEEAARKAGLTPEQIMAYMEERKIPQIFEAINTAGRRISDLVKNILSFARKGSSEFSEEDLAELMDSALTLAATDYNVERTFDFRKIRIDKKYEENLPPIMCERTNIQQVLLNILKNGAQAMEAKGEESPCFTIEIYRDKEAGTIVLSIKDNGKGMAPEVRKRIFEPFFTTKQVGVGTGLGLSLSYFIIRENHKGNIKVDSSQGKGTRFTIELPLNRAV